MLAAHDGQALGVPFCKVRTQGAAGLLHGAVGGFDCYNFSIIATHSEGFDGSIHP